MIQPRSILKPARFGFIILTVFLALMFNLMPWSSVSYFNHVNELGNGLGNAGMQNLALVNINASAFMPDMLMLVLSFWALREPQVIGIATGFLMGLILDVHYGGTLGEFALIYSVVIFYANLLHRRVTYFSFNVQALHFLPIFYLAKLLLWTLNIAQASVYTPMGYWWAPLIQAVLWPMLAFVLLIPQRMNHQKDYTRPI